MRIFIVWEKFFHYLDSITYAFEANGCEAVKYEIKSFKSGVSFFDKLALRLGDKSKLRQYNTSVKDEIYNKCLEFKPDVFLILNGNFTEMVDKELLKYFNKNGIKTILWLVDGICNYSFSREYIVAYNHIFTFEKQDVQLIQELYGIDATYLPLGAAGEIYQRIQCEKTKYDICFIGTREKKRLNILETVAKYCDEYNRRILVCGELWRRGSIKQRLEFQRNYPRLYRYADNKKITASECSAIYNASKINLNIITSRHRGINPRTFEILASGGFQLVDYNQDYEDIFENGKELVWYRNTTELLELIEYYLNNDVERETIAQNGYKVAMDKYTLNKLVKKIIIEYRQDKK